MQITIDELANAIEKNGLPKAVGSFFRASKRGHALNLDEEDVQIGAACAVGQACINLGITTNFFAGRELSIQDVQNLRSYIFHLNDEKYMSLPNIAKALRKRYKDKLNYRFTANKFNYNRVQHGN